MNKVMCLNFGWEHIKYIEGLREFKSDIVLYNCTLDRTVFANWPASITYLDKMPSEDVVMWSVENKVAHCISDQFDYSVQLHAKIASAVPCLGPSVKGSSISRDKLLQRQFGKYLEFCLTPLFSLAWSSDDIRVFFRNHGDCVVKPRDSRGSFGVSIVDSEEHIEEAFLKALSCSDSNQIIVEKFVEGQEFSVDVLLHGEVKILGVGLKYQYDKVKTVSKAIVYHLECLELFGNAESVVREVCEVFDYRYGLAHLEFIITPNGEVYLIEGSNRGGGGLTSTVVMSNVCGFSSYDFYLRSCIGKAVKLFDFQPNSSSVALRFFDHPDQVLDTRTNGLNFVKIKSTQYQTKDTKLTDASRPGFFIVKGCKDRFKSIKEFVCP